MNQKLLTRDSVDVSHAASGCKTGAAFFPRIDYGWGADVEVCDSKVLRFMGQVSALWAAVVSVLLAGATVSAQEATPAEDYVTQAWDAEDGLPHGSVSGIAQTPDGYLWLATGDGLVRFDGVRFTTFAGGVTPGLESSRVRTVWLDRSGALWIGLERGGVARLRDGRFETLRLMERGPDAPNWVSSFAQDAAGAIWVGFAPNLTVRRWSAGQWAEFSGPQHLTAGTDAFVHADRAGTLSYST